MVIHLKNPNQVLSIANHIESLSKAIQGSSREKVNKAIDRIEDGCVVVLQTEEEIEAYLIQKKPALAIGTVYDVTKYLEDSALNLSLALLGFKDSPPGLVDSSDSIIHLLNQFLSVKASSNPIASFTMSWKHR